MAWPKGKKRPESFKTAMRLRMADPGVRAKMSAATKERMADPGVRAKMSAATKERMADPGVRAKMSAAIKAGMADPGVRAKIGAAARRRMNRSCFHCGSRNAYGLIPLDGLDGEFECRSQKNCERRIVERAARDRNIEPRDDDAGSTRYAAAQAS